MPFRLANLLCKSITKICQSPINLHISIQDIRQNNNSKQQNLLHTGLMSQKNPSHQQPWAVPEKWWWTLANYKISMPKANNSRKWRDPVKLGHCQPSTTTSCGNCHGQNILPDLHSGSVSASTLNVPAVMQALQDSFQLTYHHEEMKNAWLGDASCFDLHYLQIEKNTLWLSGLAQKRATKQLTFISWRWFW